ncbi:N-lysine methyltransferase see1 [Leucoagaricus sp. SymC.cos]|nr:N-lysine methyltransferase see1 [Leucoagaricus sp. SymC.cos]
MTTELKPTKLGTKEHWDKVYAEELVGFDEIGDEGEIWFGEETVEKMVDWSLDHMPPSLNPTILEVGSGNGTLLFAHAEAGYAQKLLAGIDYSGDAVKLATNVSQSRNTAEVSFSVCDFLQDDPPILPAMMEGTSAPAWWDLILDKGTYDAIALGEKDDDGKSPAARYPARVVRLLKPGGIFLITSCNFTDDELKASFISEETGLKYHSRIQHPTYTYGGRSGSIVSSVAFQKPM